MGPPMDRSLCCSSLADEVPELRIVAHATNRGYGGALQSGFAAATKQWIFYTDGDAQYDAREIVRCLDMASDDVDVVQGFKVGRGDAWYRRRDRPVLSPHGEAAVRSAGARHRLRFPVDPGLDDGVDRPDLDVRRDLRRADACADREPTRASSKSGCRTTGARTDARNSSGCLVSPGRRNSSSRSWWRVRVRN